MASLAEEIGPYDAMEYSARNMGDALSIIIKNMPIETDDVEEKTKKWTICESQLKRIKEMTKEGIKAREIGSASAPTILQVRQMHKPLDTVSETG